MGTLARRAGGRLRRQISAQNQEASNEREREGVMREREFIRETSVYSQTVADRRSRGNALGSNLRRPDGRVCDTCCTDTAEKARRHHLAGKA